MNRLTLTVFYSIFPTRSSMKFRLPRIYYILRNKFWRFASRNWRGCESCNEKVFAKRLGVDVGSIEKQMGYQFNQLLDSFPIGGNKKNIACYFYPRRGCVEVNEVDENMKMTPLESIFVSNCPECGRALHKIRFKKK